MRKVSLHSILLFLLLSVASRSFGQATWSEPYEPFRIAGNLYYVGTYDLACYLITTPEGNILINTGLEGSVPMIRANVEALGFDFFNIKILLTTQAHFDHVAGMAEIKKMTGAQMMIHKNDAQVLADGGKSDFAMGGDKGTTFAPVKADRLLRDGDTVRLGEMKIVALHHPGHTKGSTSFLFDAKDKDCTWRVLIANIPTILLQTQLRGMPNYPEVGKDYKYTFEAMKKVQFDLWVASHASQFGLHENRKPGDVYNPTIFSIRSQYDDAIDTQKQAYLDRLKSQK
ncbi:metallo-beta-lactamase class B [Chryseolinea serpens]|uniref:Metallo-beta-lactamase class B n=1 Tax=Chryseolinea serpens TaxID=947013 RepID=A0A1M5L4C9_9BACT|nr:subclass B3 metallo-beta-lactamase [Chryseolinea serpens]SHG59964.1 metallo-beta-lactamase class B [Chryseolinea serpens]